MKYSIELIKDRLMIWAAEQGEYDPKNEDAEQDYLHFLDTCGFSVIENYNALSPMDWSGDLLTVFWGTSCYFDVFKIDNEKITQIAREQR